MSSRRSILGSALDALPPPSDPLRELFEACKTGDAVRVKKLITPQTVNARDTAGRKSTPLHFAAGYGRREVVEILIAAGAALQARDDGGLQPLHNACSFGHADVVRALLGAGAAPAARDNWGYTPLHEAAAKGKVDVCIALLQHGADPNIRNTEGKTPLDLADSATRPVLTGEYCAADVLEAARSGADDRLASLLTPLNVNVHASDGRRSTPLHLAAGYNRTRAVRLLLQRGADVHAKDKGPKNKKMSSFQDRQKSLFNTLKEAEDQYSFSKTNKVTHQDYGTIDKYTYKKLKHEMKPFRGRESIYKRPEANIRECLRAKTIPDHIKNPQKYKYYSLADVTPEQMSDSTNTATALALIRDLEEKEAAAQKAMETDTDDGVFKKPTFCISSSMKKTPKPEEEKPVFKSNKVVMPEYVVGVTKKKEKKVNLVKKEKSTSAASSCTKVELKLDHLFEDDE